jgi:hypothetical protein
MIRQGACRLVIFLMLGAAGPAAAQEACLRPIPPEEVPPPKDDPEFHAFLNEEYQAYLLGMQEYLNCLGREHESATKEVNEIMARWMLWFGDDARIHVDGSRRRPGPPDAISPSR